MLTQFVEDVERLSLPVIVIVPGAVIYELDGCVSHGFNDDYQIDGWHAFRLFAFHRKLVKKTAMAWHGLHVEPLLGF